METSDNFKSIPCWDFWNSHIEWWCLLLTFISNKIYFRVHFMTEEKITWFRSFLLKTTAFFFLQQSSTPEEKNESLLFNILKFCREIEKHLCLGNFFSVSSFSSSSSFSSKLLLMPSLLCSPCIAHHLQGISSSKFIKILVKFLVESLKYGNQMVCFILSCGRRHRSFLWSSHFICYFYILNAYTNRF